MARRAVFVRMDEKLADEIADKAKELGVTINDAMTTAARRWLESMATESG